MHGLIFASLRDYSAVRLGERAGRRALADRLFETRRGVRRRVVRAQLERLAAATRRRDRTTSSAASVRSPRKRPSPALPRLLRGERGLVRVPARDRGEDPRGRARDDPRRVAAEAARAAARRGRRPRLLHVASGGCAACSKGSSSAPPSTTATRPRGRGDPVHAPRRPWLRLHRTHAEPGVRPGHALRLRKASSGGARVAGSGRAVPRHLGGNP